jgi:hypothetical protein
MAGVVVELTGDEAKLLASMQKVIAQNTKTGDSFKETGGKAKEAADQAIKEQQRIERENKKAADAIYAEHQKMLDNKARESRQAAQAEEALARKTAFAEVQAALKAADQEIAAVEKIEAQKRKAAEKEIADANRSKEQMGAKVLGFVAGYVSIQTAVSAVNGAIKDQIELQKESLAIATDIAKAQAGAVKNLTGLSSADKAKVLQEAKKLQADVGFSDQKYIAEAIGAGYSAIGDIEATKSAVRAAAELSRNAPDELSTIASGALDVSQGSGIKDAAKNLGFLLQVGAVSRVEDPAALSRTLAPAISSGVNTVPNQDRQQASIEIGAIYSELNRFATDIEGRSTGTSTKELLSKMQEFFRKLPEERDLINAQVKGLEEKLAIDPVEQARINRANFDVTEKERIAKQFANAKGPRADDARIDLQEALAKRDQVIKDATLDDEQSLKLKKLKEQAKALDGVVDSGTISGRIDQFQKSAGLRDKFLENPFGEEAFKGGFRSLLTAGSDVAKNVDRNRNDLKFDSGTYSRTVAELETLSPELIASRNKAREEGRKQLERDDPNKVVIALVNERAANALRENRREGLKNSTKDFLAENIQSVTGGVSSDPTTAGALATANLAARRRALMSDASLGDELTRKSAAKKIENIDAATIEIANILRSVLNPKTADARTKELELMQQQNELLKDIAGQGGANANAIRAQVQAGAAQ